MWFVVLGGLMLLNEVARMGKWPFLVLFLFLPIIVTFTVWPQTADEGSSVGTWIFAVKASLDPNALSLVSFLSIAVNIAVFVFHFAKIYKHKRNPIRAEVYPDLAVYRAIAADR